MSGRSPSAPTAGCPGAAASRSTTAWSSSTATRLVYGSGGELWLGDIRGGEPKRLYTSPPGHRIVNISGSRDGRSLTWIDNADESDIWLMTLDEKTTP